MKGKDFLNKIHDLDDNLIEESKFPTYHKKWSADFIKVAGLSACILLFVGGIWVHNGTSNKQTISPANGVNNNKVITGALEETTTQEVVTESFEPQTTNTTQEGLMMEYDTILPHEYEEITTEELMMYDTILPYEYEIEQGNEKVTIPVTSIITEPEIESSTKYIPFEMHLYSMDDMGGELKITNHTSYDAVYDEYFTFEKLVNGEWKVLEPKEGYAVHDLAYELPKGKTCSLTIDWASAYEKLETNAKYRITKKIHGKTTETVSVEFGSFYDETVAPDEFIPEHHSEGHHSENH